MMLTLQRRLASQIMKCGLDRVWFDNARIEDIKAAISKADIRRLILDGAIRIRPIRSISNIRSKKIKTQKSKGRQDGQGSRKGKKTIRSGKKQGWVKKIRVLRGFMRTLRDHEIIEKKTYFDLSRKVKGGFFRSKRHIKLYIEDHELVKK